MDIRIKTNCRRNGCFCLLRRICDPTLINIRFFSPQHNKTLATALMLAD